jgi:hypothetical protein
MDDMSLLRTRFFRVSLRFELRQFRRPNEVLFSSSAASLSSEEVPEAVLTALSFKLRVDKLNKKVRRGA